MDKKKYRVLVIEDNPGDFVIIEDLLMEALFAPIPPSILTMTKRVF